MPIISIAKAIHTKGNSDCHNITKDVQNAVTKSGISQGIATVFIPGATAGVTTIEFEDGVVSDLSSAMNRLIPEDIEYQHNKYYKKGKLNEEVLSNKIYFKIN